MSSSNLPRNSVSSCSDSAASASSSNWSLEANYESLAWRLRHFDCVLEALQELRSAFFRNELALPDNELFQSASRIMDLLDIAKCTLEDAGMELWPHSLCVVGLRPHKKAYFALLKLLQTRADCLDAQLQARCLRLTSRLSTNFSIRISPAYDFYLTPKPRNPKQFPKADSEPFQLKKLCRTMPPPDAFPPSEFIPESSSSFLGPQRRRRRMRLEFPTELQESLGLESPSYMPHPHSNSQRRHHEHASPHVHAGALGSRRPGSDSIMGKRYRVQLSSLRPCHNSRF
ncbi:hypothetical protein GYMLUDRAFT_50127 [Collybiopsis luxurians FD-317 M1]|uniref:Uncharacterized protein n=1 Tax=Collybiopsis luxurians FD-317 M1 TaxID=944289 RepID=A0A0D0AP88_9AGAR|nr:hypothetical protein GYMLUDRAFT_50127 [Collybiopsis luxurians FD-317 M1]